MGTSPDQMRAEINATRDRLSDDVNRLADHASPRHIVRRRTERVRGTFTGFKEQIMGSASDTAHSVAEGARSAAGSLQGGAGQVTGTTRDTAQQAGEMLSQAPEHARRQTQGHPLAAGLIAFGVGVLASSLLPTTEAEEQAASALVEQGKESLEPVKQAALDSAQHLKEHARDAAQSAADEVKGTAQEALQTTQEEARDQAGTVAGQARDSAQQVTENTRQQ
ncbi:DUF3618 domain-containing protein [Streptomyces galbus]|uniref:DUF3618 domain-containing protein n=1 Tax=Streptomyces galbus TaxID=33898 RepID=A0ABX1IXU7_STRGB|nr:DUF3618 domain-containing protein [Streptomyces galbus]NKQ29081.1 DUF3618 domain-containing protein [Streptomyces galbus]